MGKSKFSPFTPLYMGSLCKSNWMLTIILLPTSSVNWRAFVTFVLAILPAFPGYILSCANINKPPDNWMKLSRLGFITGFVLALIIYPLLSFIWPPRGLGEGEDHHDEETFVLPSAFDQSRPTQGRFSVVDAVEEASDETPHVPGKGEAKNEYTREKHVAVAF